MTPSIHDNQLISYEVQCERRTVTLRTEYREKNKPMEFTNVVFERVQGYHFQNDAFGNIVFDVAEVAAEQFVPEYGAEISELHRMTGSPTWAVDLASALEHLHEQGIKAFVLSSSIGLSGWVLAEDMSIVSVGEAVSADLPRATYPDSGPQP